MQFESHATPFAGTPQQRYATLHRAIESGLDSDELWRELAEVSIELGHRGEAVRCARRIRNEADRRAIEYRLQRLGVLLAAHHPDDPPGGARTDSGEARQNGLPVPGLAEHLLDAAQYLLHQQMPWFVLTTMLAFPLIVGVGGFLTAGGSLLLLAAIAALPGLSVLTAVAAMGRQILLKSSAGESDVPNLPELGRLLGEARRFALDALLVIGIFASAPVAAALLDAPVAAVALALAGVFLAPIAFALRQVRGDVRVLAPSTLLRAAVRCGPAYPAMAAVCAALFAPAAAVEWFAFDRPVWVQVAIVGPLCVLPVLAASRLLGCWLDSHREALGELLRAPERPAAPPVPPAAAPHAANEDARRPRRPRRPAALENFRAPVARRITHAGAAQPAPQRPAGNQPAVARAIEGRRPSQRPHPRPAGDQTQPKAKPPRAVQPRQPSSQQPQPQQPRPQAQPQPQQPAAQPQRQHAKSRGLKDAPDLAHMPGAVVVSGQERLRRGAAARRP